MRRFFRVILDALLYVIFIAFFLFEFILAIGFAEIILDTQILFKSDYALPVALGLSFATSTLLYFVFMIKRYGSTPGIILARRNSGEPANRRPFYAYIVILMFIAGSYLISYAVSAPIFNSRVSAQEKTLEAMGVSFDWKSYYPITSYDDPENAVPHLIRANKALSAESAKERDRLWSAFSKDDVTGAAAIFKDIEKLLAENKGLSAQFDKALKYKHLLWYDVKNMKEKDIFKTPYPETNLLNNFMAYSALEAIDAARRGDLKPTEKHFVRLKRTLELLSQDPHDMPLIMQNRLKSDALKFMSALAKVTAGDAKTFKRAAGFQALKKITDSLPVDNDRLVRVTMAQTSEFAAVQKVLMTLEDRGSVFGSRGSKMLFDLYYGIWGRFDRLSFLKGKELVLKAAKESDAAKKAQLYEEAKAYMKDHVRIASLTSLLIEPGSDFFYEYFMRTNKTFDAKKTAALIFAAAIEYKMKSGRYPKDLNALVPEYFAALPKSAIDGSDFIYAVNGEYMEVNVKDNYGNTVSNVTFIGKKPKATGAKPKIPTAKK